MEDKKIKGGNKYLIEVSEGEWGCRYPRLQ